jgi:hypothetical protein
MKRSVLFLAAIAMFAMGRSAEAQLAVSSTQPGLNASNISRTAAIVVNFDRPVDTTTFTPADFHAFARWMGPVLGEVSFSNSDSTVTLTPASPFSAGDYVTLYMSHRLRGADGTFLRQAGYTLTFTVATAPSPGTFCHRTTFSDRTNPNVDTRIYGGLACDLNRDGAPDLTLINEVSGDLRTYLNRGDHSGLFQTMLVPASIPFNSSPNKSADFNGDGFVDIVTSSYSANQIAITFGHGDGSWAEPVIVSTGAFPVGLAILDFDGDGDMDIACSIRNIDAIALLFNNGSGFFGAPVYISSGGDGPYGLAAADMNNDGILDLVVGHFLAETAVILRGNGDGTFTFVSSRSMGGANRVIVCGDVNGDGFMDIAGSNNASLNASILLGNGNGTLQTPFIFPTNGSASGTDLLDIDGDGDLDWIVSAFGAHRWYLLQNNGAGAFTLLREFVAPGNPACSVAADFDGDGDLDLILLDETTDLVLVMINSAGACYANCDCSSTVPTLNANDFQCFLNKFATGDITANCDGSSNLPILNANDFQCYLNAFAVGCS